MRESFVEWRPAAVSEPTVSLLSLHDDRDGLVVRVAAAERTIEISFGVVMAFRSTLEESCLDFWAHFHGAKPSTGPFWIVEGSGWLATFSDADLIHHEGAKHYMIVTDDERIDILTSRTPVALILDSQ